MNIYLPFSVEPCLDDSPDIGLIDGVPCGRLEKSVLSRRLTQLIRSRYGIRVDGTIWANRVDANAIDKKRSLPSCLVS